MNRRVIFSGLAVAALAAAGLSAVLPTATASSSRPINHFVHACAAKATPGHATCFAIGVANAHGQLKVSAKPLAAAFTPTDIQKAYKLSGKQSGGRTVAIVDAYGYPGLASDLATFRSNYGLSPCTVGNGCLTIMNQNGGSTPPATDAGWDIEQALDVDAVSSACPDCKILVVQATSNSWANLGTAVNRAAIQSGVVAISNSYGGGNMPNNSMWEHKGIAVTASTGDNGYNGGSYPASDSKVVAIGGTSVFRDSSARGYHETAWSGAGSGCGTNPQPAWQAGAGTTCSTKASADVSAAADPSNGGLNIYCGTVSGCGGWAQYGGTSEASPIIASVYALSGNVAKWPAKYPYNRTGHLYDVTSGSNGSCGAPVCQARAGWDGPTGLGTPKGVAAF